MEIRRLACICDGYEWLSCEVVGKECALHEPMAMWLVKWFHYDKFYDVEVVAPNPELARTFSLRSTSEQEGIRMTELMFISCERIG